MLSGMFTRGFLTFKEPVYRYLRLFSVRIVKVALVFGGKLYSSQSA